MPVTAKAKRQAIVKAYGRSQVEVDMDNFYYARRDLAKLPDAGQRGWHERNIRTSKLDWPMRSSERCRPSVQRDGDKYFNEAAGNLIDVIASYVECHANDR